ncbi:MAG: hypothetical protein L6408_06820 [Nanoarchaeota archaeon]|nr:hypothetical protein [Nanoarchaeota archaeon]
MKESFNGSKIFFSTTLHLLNVIALLTIALLLIFSDSNLTGKVSFETGVDPSNETKANPSNNKVRTWTKAICNEENYCIDILITCEGSKVVNLKPFPEGVHFSKEWEDSRPEAFRSVLC